MLTKEYQCPAIVRTCINIMHYILQKNQAATFGFIGANTYDPITKTEEPVDNTKRYRVYKYAMEGRMGTVTFAHAWLPRLSRYVMVNKSQNKEFILDEINRIFQVLYQKEV
jgi:hypothetical protein